MLKVLSYWNLNVSTKVASDTYIYLKVLSYWNLNFLKRLKKLNLLNLKVLSYWNLNFIWISDSKYIKKNLKYYHIGI